MEKRLFLVCPDAHLETIIPTHFSGQSYFLTALGAAFSHNMQYNSSAVADVVEREHITELCIVVDTYCRFIRSVVCRQKGYGTKAEAVLQTEYQANRKAIERRKGAWNRCLELSRLHLTEQALCFSRESWVEEESRFGQFKIRTFLYFRNEDRMEEIFFDQEQQNLKNNEALLEKDSRAWWPVAGHWAGQMVHFSRFSLLILTVITLLIAFFSDGLVMKELIASAFILTMLYVLHFQGSDKRLT